LSTNDALLGEIDGQCGVVLPSGWIARVGRAAADQVECNNLLSEVIRYFDTRYSDHEGQR